MKKIQNIEGTTGLEATYANGSYTVTVWETELDESHDFAQGYELIFCKSNTYIAHLREYVTAENLETEMRKYQPDIRKWRKVEYSE